MKRRVRNPAPKSRKSVPVFPRQLELLFLLGRPGFPLLRQPLSASSSLMTPRHSGSARRPCCAVKATSEVPQLSNRTTSPWRAHVPSLPCLSSPACPMLPTVRPKRGSVLLSQEQQAHCHAFSAAIFLTAPSSELSALCPASHVPVGFAKGRLGTGSHSSRPSCQGSAAGNILGSNVTLTTRKLSTASHLFYTELDTYRSEQDKILLVITDHNPVTSFQ